MSDQGTRAAETKMREAGQSEEATRNFLSARERLVSGQDTLVSSSTLEPAGDVPRLDDLADVDAAAALARVAMIKLNGGLATSMGLRTPKSLVEAREGRTFLDLIVGQVLSLRRRLGVELPLVLMDSESTRDATLPVLAAYDGLGAGLEPDFLQSMVPKLDAETLAPVQWAENPRLEWCPPGHGDVYGALRRSGMLQALLERGFRYAMISNSDNLGATIDARIAAHIERERIPFLMEVFEGTEAERKGGHIARRIADGQLILREIAQTPEADEDSFRDFRRWRYYNSNNLWVDLQALSDTLEQRDGVLPLPLIVNHKTVDPRNADSTPVLQLESAMGAAIESFDGAQLLEVPRTRFVPVKTTDDLLLLRSDVFAIGGDDVVTPIPERVGDLPYVELDKTVYKLIDEFEARFPAGSPSLRRAERLVVRGDVTFEADIVVTGAASIDAAEPTTIAAGSALGD